MSQDFLNFLAAFLSIALTCALTKLIEMIFNKRCSVFKNNIFCKTLCDQALILLISGVVIYWYLLIQYIPDGKSPSLNTMLGFASCVFLIIVAFWTYKCLKICWRLIKISSKLSDQMKAGCYFTVIFVFGTLCFLWTIAAKHLPNKIMPLLLLIQE